MDPLLPPDTLNAVLAALRKGRKIEAVKLYREATGQNLAEAKDAVERIEVALPHVEAGTALAPADRARIIETVRSAGIVEAIKVHMAATGKRNLLESKEAVEALIAEEGLVPPSLPSGREGGPRVVPPSIPSGLIPAKHAAVLAALSRGNKIEAIRLYREATGEGLAESKNAVEAMAAGGAGVEEPGPVSDGHRTPLPNWDPREEKKKAGCLGAVVFLVTTWLLAAACL